MGAVDPVFQGVDTALDFGNHPTADNPAGEQGGDLLQADLPDQGAVILGVRSTPRTSVRRMSFSAPREMASSAAAVSALML